MDRNKLIRDRGQTPKPLSRALTAALYVGSATALAAPKVLDVVAFANPKRW